jgi:hypothetical protein
MPASTRQVASWIERFPDADWGGIDTMTIG